MISPRVSFVGIVTTVLLFVAFGPTAMWAQEAEPAVQRPIEYQRIFVPANRPKEWPQSVFEFAPQIELAEFERMVREFSRTQNQVEDSIPIRGLTYQARLDGSTLAGTVDISLPQGRQASQGFVSLERSNLLYFNEEERLLDAPDVLVGGFQKEHGAYLREGFEAIRLDWSYQGSVLSTKEMGFRLELIFSPQTDFYLELPPGWDVKLEEGILLQAPGEQRLAETRLWHLAPQWEGKLYFQLVASEGEVNTAAVTATQLSSYEVRTNVCHISTQYALYSQPLASLDLMLPQAFVLSRVLLNGQELSEPDVHDVGDGSRQLRVPQAVFPGGQTATVTVEGVAPLELGDYSRVKLPIIFATSQPTESHVVAVELEQGINLSYSVLKNAQQVTFVPHNSLGRSNLKFRLYDSTAAIDLQLFRPQADVEWTIVNKVTVNDLLIESDCVVSMGQGQRTAETIELPLAEGWHANELMLNEDDTAVRWEETSRDGRRVLRIEKTAGLPQVRFTLRRTRDNDFGSLRLADFRPFDLPVGVGNTEWIAVKPDAGFDLQLEPQGLVDRVAIEDLPQEIAERFGSDWKIPVFAMEGHGDLQHLVRVSRKRAAYDALLDIQATLREASYQEHAVIRLNGTGLLPETLFVWSTRPWSSEVRWTTPDLVTIGWTAVTTSASDPENEREPYYIYELRPPAENAFPLVLEGTFPETNSSYEIPLLLAVPSAEPQAGTLSLRVPDTCQVTARAGLLRKVYSNQSTSAAQGRLQQFEYRPIEIRRLAQARNQLLVCDWADRVALPKIFSPEARHALSIENDGSLRYTSTWKLVVDAESEAIFELPPGAQVETVQWDGQPWHRWRHAPAAEAEARSTMSVDMPDSSAAALLEIAYQRPPGTVGLVHRVDAEFARAQFPTSSQLATFTLGSRLRQMRFPEIHWTGLGLRLRHALWTGLFQAAPAASPESEEAARDATAHGEAKTAVGVKEVFPPAGVWVIRQGLLLPISIGALLLGVVVGWRYFPRRPRWVLAGVFGVVAVAVWLPEVLSPLSSGLFLGLTLGGLGGFLMIPSTAVATPRSSASTVTVAGLMLVAILTGTLGEISAAFAADEVSAPTVYPVLIPMDGERKPIGQAYLPQPFYERLVAASREFDRQLPGYVVEGIRYELTVQETNIAVTTRIELVTTQGNQAVRIPFDPRLGTGLTTALLNGGILPSPFDEEDAELNLTFREPGRHVVEIQSALPLTEPAEERQRLHIETPPNVSSAVTLADSLRMGAPEIRFAGRSLLIEPSNIRQTIPLGTTDSFDIEWSSPALQQQFEFQELDLLEYREDEVRLRVRLKLTAGEQPAGPIMLEADSRLLLVPRQATPWKVETKSSEEAAATRLFAISAVTGDSLPDEIELLFTLDGAQQVGQLRFPSVRVKNGALQRRWVAVAAAEQLQVQSQALSRVNVRSQEEFLREWQDPIPDFRFAVASADTEPLDWLISTRPITTRGIADFKHRLLLDEDGYQFETRVQIETYSGDPSQYVIQLMPDAQIDSVQYLVDGLVRPTQWHYDSASGELGILLLNSANGLQDLTIRGQARQAAQPTDLILSPIEIRDVVTQSCQVQLFRDHSVLVRSLPGNNLLPMQEESLEGLEHDMVPVGQWEVPEPGEPVRWQVLPNNVLITGDLLTVARRVDGNWRIDLSGKLDIRSGIVEKMQWLVPKEFTLDPQSFDGFRVTSRLVPDGSAHVYEVTPTMPLGSSISFDWSGTLETTPGQRTEFSSIQLIGQPRVGQFVAVPNQVDNQEVLWSSLLLRPTAVNDRWLNAHTPTGYQLLRATRPDFKCQMLERANRRGEPVVDSLESTLLIGDRGNVFGVTRAAIFPQGSHEIELTCPPNVEILAASVDFQRQARLDSAEGTTVKITLQSNSLPQVVEFAFRTKLETDGGRRSYRLLRPHLPYPTNTQELLRVALPPRMTLRDVPVSAPTTWNQSQVATAFRLKEASRDFLSGLGSAEIERWDTLRMDQAFAALNRFQELLRAQGESTESAQAAIAAMLGDAATRVETWPVSGRDRIPESLVTAAEMGTMGFQYFIQEASATPLHLRESRAGGGSLGPPLAISLFSLLAGCLLFLNLPVQRRWGPEVRQWVLRYPQVCGIMVGLFWWLFLPPHGIGLLLILAVVWASMPNLPRALGGRV